MILGEAFQAAVRGDKFFEEACNIARKNSEGRIWLIGGGLYRAIAAQLGGRARPESDLDFLVEELSMPFRPKGWSMAVNRYGNPKLVRQEHSIDIVPLDSVYSILHRGIEPSVDNYLTGVPFTVQSIAYDLEAKQLLGKIGMRALLERTVAVNDEYFAEYAAKMRGTCVTNLLREKAQSLDFTPIFPAA